jgi:hypothetical protein
MSGTRFSVRFPRRIVPVCVNEPIGFAIPLRIASTPATKVVLTAPSPTSNIPSFPVAAAISTPLVAIKIYPYVKILKNENDNDLPKKNKSALVFAHRFR